MAFNFYILLNEKNKKTFGHALNSPGRISLMFVSRKSATQTSEEMRFCRSPIPPSIYETIVQQKSRFFPQQLRTNQIIKRVRNLELFHLIISYIYIYKIVVLA